MTTRHLAKYIQEPALSPLADRSGCDHARPELAVAWLSDQAIVAAWGVAARAVAAEAAER
jgi:hypothetical protein